MRDTSPNGVKRRRFLTSLVTATGLGTLSGCTALWDQTGATDVTVHNAAEEAKTVSVTVTAAGAEEPHTARTVDIEPGDTVDPVNRSKLPTNDSYTVDVAVEDGPGETFEWDEPTLELAPLWVLVDASENIKFLLQAG
jgi:plastocyanin